MGWNPFAGTDILDNVMQVFGQMLVSGDGDGDGAARKAEGAGEGAAAQLAAQLAARDEKAKRLEELEKQRKQGKVATKRQSTSQTQSGTGDGSAKRRKEGGGA
eukprot:COSAG04_NODE_18_length_39571_cov_50.788128_29_plen_103_part_00